MTDMQSVRATINFGGLLRDQIVSVDPADPYMAALISKDVLVPVDIDEPDLTEPAPDGEGDEVE